MASVHAVKDAWKNQTKQEMYLIHKVCISLCLGAVWM